MRGRNPRFETFFAKPRPWRAELNALRRILLDCRLTEELKWRQPCYTFDGANIVILGSFKNHCSLGFFKGSLMPDPENVLVAPGPNSRAARMIRFTGLDDIAGREEMLARYVRAAIAVEASGRKVDFSANKTVSLPDELRDALRKSAALKRAFQALTPGRQRGWVLHFQSAKLKKTRQERIAKAAPRILKGEGFHDAYKEGERKGG